MNNLVSENSTKNKIALVKEKLKNDFVTLKF